MPELGEYRPSNVELQQQFSELLRVLPQSGIAYRGDMAVRVGDMQQHGLITPESNYIVLLPPTTTFLRQPEQLLTDLQEGIEFALTYADIGKSPATPLMNSDFIDFATYYQQYPGKLYALSWFTSPTEDQFSQVAESGVTWYGANSHNKAGQVSQFGEIPPSSMHTPIVASIGDIKTAQDVVTQRLYTGKVPKEALEVFRLRELQEKHPTYFKVGKVGKPFIKRALSVPFHGFDPFLQNVFGRDYLKDLGRWEFHKEISKVMTEKLIQTATKELHS